MAEVEERARMLEELGRQWADRVREGRDVVVVAGTPGSAELFTVNHPAMLEAALASNHFLAAAFGDPAGTREALRDARHELHIRRVGALGHTELDEKRMGGREMVEREITQHLDTLGPDDTVLIQVHRPQEAT